MKRIFLIPFSLLVMVRAFNPVQAQTDPVSTPFQNAFDELKAMLEGTQPLSFERAVFITENAYYNNAISYGDFQAALDVHAAVIHQLSKTNEKPDWKKYKSMSLGIPIETDEQTKEKYRKVLMNWAIHTYLTDTVSINLEGYDFQHLPFAYSSEDPFGTAEWKNSQVLNLLGTQKGNCFALVTLFKIFSERFHTEANVVTAPQHIYIVHRDLYGRLHNIELATRSFPGSGTIETLTYSTYEAVVNDIALRTLDLKQSVGLCLVYLAKGYEHKFKISDDDFLLTCAETALQYDPHNLNALLLKAQVYEQRVMKRQLSAAPYEKMLSDLYRLGYRQIPDDAKNIILAKIRGSNEPVTITNKTPNPFESIGEHERYATLSWGLFEEVHKHEKLVRFGRTVFNTEKGKVVKFLDADNSSYQVDPVVFALSIDPLTKAYPMLTPYQFASNMPLAAVDLDGLEAMLAIYGSGEGGDEPQFRKEAAQDVERGIAKGQAKAVFAADKFIELLVTETKNEGSIGYIFIASHGSVNGVFFDSRPGSGSALSIDGEDWPAYGFKNKGIGDVANNNDIAFDKNALCVFAGCNMGNTKANKPGYVAVPFASKFTEETGVPSIAAEGRTQPIGDTRVADYNYYLFERINGKVIKTGIGKELSQDLIKQVYQYLRGKNEPENAPSLLEIRKPDLSNLLNVPLPTLSIPERN